MVHYVLVPRVYGAFHEHVIVSYYVVLCELVSRVYGIVCDCVLVYGTLCACA